MRSAGAEALVKLLKIVMGFSYFVKLRNFRHNGKKTFDFEETIPYAIRMFFSIMAEIKNNLEKYEKPPWVPD